MSIAIMAASSSLVGKLLIAMPTVQNADFRRSVILVCAHTAEHAMGLVLNRKLTGVPLAELCGQLGITGNIPPHMAVIIGGPVRQDRGFVLHSDDFDSPGATVPVVDGVCLTANRDALSAMVSDIPPERAALALGYAGWGQGQIEKEVAANIWLIADPETGIVFDRSYDTKWSRALHSLGVSPDQLHTTGGSA